ncbi:MAG: KOW domain-containing RNA-binding protein [Clostridia bacterium]|nr:KOW domain-containing RNA-binding protein [Clostridia bacterium]
MSLVPGSVVISNAGRDKGRKFITLAKEVDENYIYISDGNLRKIENPKKKKLKHVIITGRVIEKLAIKLEQGKPLQNAEIFKEIRKLDEVV